VSRLLHILTDLRHPSLVVGLPQGRQHLPLSPVGPGHWVAAVPDVGHSWYFALADHAAGRLIHHPTGDWYHMPPDLQEAWWQAGTILDVDPATLDFDLIDAHTHPYDRNAAGRMIYDDRIMLELLPQQGVGMALTMTAGPLDRQRRRLAQLCDGRPWIVPLVWVQARHDSAEAVEALIRDQGFRGMKFHPTVDRYPADGTAMDPFMAVAEKYGVPVQIHSAVDDRSRPERLAELGARWPRVPVVMVHSELGALDKGPAIDTIRRLPNLIAETSWTSPEAIVETMGLVGSDRTMHGTDATVDGHAHFDRHSVPNCHGEFVNRLPDVVEKVRQAVSPIDFANWSRLTAIRLYKLRLAPVLADRAANRQQELVTAP
jgi:hypothetical protein